MDILGTIKNYRNYRRTVSELGRLTDRELADVGMIRADIGAFARKSCYRKK